MALFFIDTSTGQAATQRQLIDAGIATDTSPPPKPWLRIQGSGDATTMWHAVMRKPVKGIFIGALVLRHSDHHASLLADGWEEVGVEELRAGPASEASSG